MPRLINSNIFSLGFNSMGGNSVFVEVVTVFVDVDVDDGDVGDCC